MRIKGFGKELVDNLRWALRKARVNDYKYLESIWDAHKTSAHKKLGTGENALVTLRNVGSLIGAQKCARLMRRNNNLIHWWCAMPQLHADLDELKSMAGRYGNSAVGDPKDVHFIAPPRHSIGYEIWTSANGEFTLEVFEGLYWSLRVLLRKRKIIATEKLTNIRHERYGNARIV